MSSEHAPTNVIATALIRRAGLAPRPDLERMAADYMARTKKARRVGVWTALGMVMLGLSLSSQSDSVALKVAQLSFGYLLGSVVAGWVLQRHLGPSTVRTASLQRRTLSSLLPWWARVLPWVTLLPCVASPLLLLGHHPTYTHRYTISNGFATTSMTWFAPSTLTAISVTAAAALLLTCLLQWRLTRRKVEVKDRDAAHLDLVTRALSARATAGSASALGLAFLSGLGDLSDDPLQSRRCNAALHCRDAYHSTVLSFLYNMSIPLLLIALIPLAVSGLMVLPRSLRTGRRRRCDRLDRHHIRRTGLRADPHPGNSPRRQRSPASPNPAPLRPAARSGPRGRTRHRRQGIPTAGRDRDHETASASRNPHQRPHHSQRGRPAPVTSSGCRGLPRNRPPAQHRHRACSRTGRTRVEQAGEPVTVDPMSSSRAPRYS